MGDSEHYEAPYSLDRPIAVSKALAELGDHVAVARRLLALRATTVAERAGISRATLRTIEQGIGSASSENLLRVLRVLGVMDRVVAAADPYTTDVGRLRAGEQLPHRVRE